MIHNKLGDSITDCLIAGGGNADEMWLKILPSPPTDCKFIHVHVCVSEAVRAKTTFVLSQKQSQSVILLFFEGNHGTHFFSEQRKKKKKTKT